METLIGGLFLREWYNILVVFAFLALKETPASFITELFVGTQGELSIPKQCVIKGNKYGFRNEKRTWID